MSIMCNTLGRRMTTHVVKALFAVAGQSLGAAHATINRSARTRNTGSSLRAAGQSWEIGASVDHESPIVPCRRTLR